MLVEIISDQAFKIKAKQKTFFQVFSYSKKQNNFLGAYHL